jgi:DNA primase
VVSLSTNVTLKDVRHKILEELDIAQLYSEMVDEELIDPKAITNPELLDENGKVNIDFEFDLDEDLKKRLDIICPFHNTPNNDSTSLYRETGTFKCFAGGCPTEGKVTNIIDFYMMLRFGIKPKLLSHEESKPAFIQTLKELAERIGIVFDYNNRKLSDEELREIKTLEIRKRAAEIYHWAWKKHKFAQKAKDYMLNERGFKYGAIPFHELVDKYKIGFAPGYFGWTWMYDQLKKNFSEEDILRSGVVFKYQPKDKETKQPIGEQKTADLLVNGVVLPYFSKGKINNLYARSLDPLNKKMRHLRLSGTVDIPINFDVAKTYRDIIIVEGEFSWLSLIALGYENTIGNRGTNGLAPEHVKLLQQEKEIDPERCQTIYLCFDSDGPGQKALAITGERLVREGFDVRVIQLTDGDPNDLLQKHKEKAKEMFDELFEQSITFEAYMILFAMRNTKLTKMADMVGLLKKVEPFIGKVPKEQLFFISYEVAEIAAKSLKIDEKYLVEYLHKSWIADGKKPVQDEIPGLNKALNQQWIFAIDNPRLYKLVQKTEIAEKAIDISKVDIKAFVKKVSEKSVSKNIVFNSKMQREKKTMLFDELKGFKFIMFVEKEEFEEKETISMDEITSAMVLPQ